MPHKRGQHVDHNLENPAYGFEFSNVVYRDSRRFEEIKEVQRAEWDDAVPILGACDYSGGFRGGAEVYSRESG